MKGKKNQNTNHFFEFAHFAIHGVSLTHEPSKKANKNLNNKVLFAENLRVKIERSKMVTRSIARALERSIDRFNQRYFTVRGNLSPNWGIRIRIIIIRIKRNKNSYSRRGLGINLNSSIELHIDPITFPFPF